MNETASPQAQSEPQAAGRPVTSVLSEVPAVLKGAFSAREHAREATAYARFRQDPYFLLRYYIANLAVLGGAIALGELLFGRLGALNHPAFWLLGLVLFVLPSFSLIFLSGLYYLLLVGFAQPAAVTPWSLALIPAGILAGTVSAALMHNAAHGNFRGAATNRIVGELCGLFQLTGFPGWCISHFIHHGAPDNPNKDPHPPADMTFRAYVNAMGAMMKESLTNTYFENFGDNRHSRATWSLIDWMLPLVRYARIAFILMLLGPTVFVMLYVPFKIANALIYGDFNYRTHRPTADGGYEVLNLNHTRWYKLLNAISFGSYFHKSHHRHPNLFDPRHAAPDDRPFVTYRR